MHYMCDKLKQDIDKITYSDQGEFIGLSLMIQDNKQIAGKKLEALNAA